MADASGVFSNTVRGALAIAEAGLLDNGIDKKKVRDALGEFRSTATANFAPSFRETRWNQTHGRRFLLYVTKAGDGLDETVPATNDP